MRQIIEAMYAGQPAPLGDRGKLSAIAKQLVPGPWHITPTGLAGDQQADPVHHGGAEKAVHHYPRDHYALWLAEYPALAAALAQAPAFGENFSLSGMTEATVHVGDIYRIGTVTLQVSQGRQPCWKLNARFNKRDMARLVQSTGRTGWYYRVLEPGVIEAGDRLELIQRPQPDWPLARVAELFYHRTLALEELAALADLSELAPNWRELAAKRVRTRAVEDWDRRLLGAD